MLSHLIARGLQLNIWRQGCDFPCRWGQSCDTSVSEVVLLKGCSKSLSFSCSLWSKSPLPNWWGAESSFQAASLWSCHVPNAGTETEPAEATWTTAWWPCGCSEPDLGGLKEGWRWGVNIKDLLVPLCAWDGFFANSFLVPPSTVAGKWICQLLL